MNYRVKVVDDAVLPEGHDFVLVQVDGRMTVCCFREGAITPRVLEDSWAAYRTLANVPELRSAS